MSHSDPEYPLVNVSYELRCTQRALADLDAADAIPSDLESIVGLTQRRDIVSKFFDQRSEVPISVPNGVDLQRLVQFDLELAILIHDFDY